MARSAQIGFGACNIVTGQCNRVRMPCRWRCRQLRISGFKLALLLQSALVVACLDLSIQSATDLCEV
jgi:hypothetical protein